MLSTPEEWTDEFIDWAKQDRAKVGVKNELITLRGGVFERIGGLILGKHEKSDDLGTGHMPHEILTEFMGDVDFPVLAQFDCCHTHPMLTLPIGRRARLDADGQMLALVERFIGE